MDKKKIIALIVVLIFVGVIAYFFISSSTANNTIPSYITGDRKMMYEWSKVSPGKEILQQIPCYCGCKYEGHKNAYNCFWTDNGKFDKHSATCSVCLDIGLKAKKMYEEGKNVCEIRKEIDKFYEPNKELATDTPMPPDCV